VNLNIHSHFDMANVLKPRPSGMARCNPSSCHCLLDVCIHNGHSTPKCIMHL
jgi:hypothetical protein